MTPNIFDISTKELSQDAFITWLLQWADSQNERFDIDLNKCGIDFLTELIKIENPDFSEKIISVRTSRQFENIDIWVEVNNNYLIIIEDKINSGQHSGQLVRYKAIAEKWCNEQISEFKPPLFIYLKTGNESQKSLNKAIEAGFKPYNRLQFIKLLQRHDLKNDIYIDFKTRLLRIEQENNEWEGKMLKDWKGNDWQGFYQHLETAMIIDDWHYVNNPNGGFWNAVLNWDSWGVYPAYLQTEQSKLCFKISTDPEESEEIPINTNRSLVRDEFSNIIINSAKINGIEHIRRPDRFGNGNYMTVAIVDGENWLGNENDIINKENVVKKLQNYKNFLLETINTEA